ncbi:MAG: hypothetical protein IKJ74_00295 [Clostridia bacterium]|nr:hypothetical protein [Clostridia bacterium]
MLGYVKCDEGELLVKHQRLYRAVYCGLCHSIRVTGMHALLPFHNYDFVFLALFRMLVTGEPLSLERDRCFLHPFRKGKQRLCHNPTLAYTAFAALVLTVEKMRDDLLDSDVSFSRRCMIRLTLPRLIRALRRYEKNESQMKGLSEKVAALLAEGRELEKASAELDILCENFARCLSLLFSFGTSGKEARLLSGMGDLLGRYLYTLDALDDREKDLKSGAFNPVLKNGVLPSDKALCQMDLVLSFMLGEMKKILDLVEGEPNLLAICENIIGRGLPATAHPILNPERGDKNERPV